MNKLGPNMVGTANRLRRSDEMHTLTYTYGLAMSTGLEPVTFAVTVQRSSLN